MKVLFLDVDGVLNSWPTMKEWHANKWGLIHQIGRDLVARVNRIVEETGCKVVLSSIWRHDCRSFPKLEDLSNYFKKFGATFDLFDKTPRDRNEIRGKEIQMWLDENPGVESIVILDDDGGMGLFIPYWVKTSMETGITDEHVNQAIVLLSIPFVARPLEYAGSCKNVLENEGFWPFATDATELQQLVDRGKQLKDYDFLALTGMVEKDLEQFDMNSMFSFWCIPGESVAWLYDEDYDTHHFFI